MLKVTIFVHECKLEIFYPLQPGPGFACNLEPVRVTSDESKPERVQVIKKVSTESGETGFVWVSVLI